MATKFDFEEKIDISWCPGCGNFALLKILKEVFEELGLKEQDICISSGIGQAAKMPQYINNINFYNGLHGRSLPVAAAIQMANPKLTLIAEGGDGDSYSEGGNHFMHNVRRNLNILHLVHDNQIYGLTKGQGSPTSGIGLKTSTHPDGSYNEPFNPMATAITLGAGFVARAFTGNANEAKKVIKEALQYEGYALVNIFDPCVTFNKVNTFKWYKDNTEPLAESYDPTDKMKALEVAFNNEKLATGIIYKNPNKRKTLVNNLKPYENGDLTPLYARPNHDLNKVKELLYK